MKTMPFSPNVFTDFILLFVVVGRSLQWGIVVLVITLAMIVILMDIRYGGLGTWVVQAYLTAMRFAAIAYI